MSATAAMDSAASTARSTRAQLSRVSTLAPVLPRHPIISPASVYLVQTVYCFTSQLPIFTHLYCSHLRKNYSTVTHYKIRSANIATVSYQARH